MVLQLPCPMMLPWRKSDRRFCGEHCPRFSFAYQHLILPPVCETCQQLDLVPAIAALRVVSRGCEVANYSHAPNRMAAAAFPTS